MWRTAIVTAIVYAWGFPMFDGTRPSILEPAVKSFHAEVNSATRNAGAEVRRIQLGTAAPLAPFFHAAMH